MTAKNNPYFSLLYQVDLNGMQTARSSGETVDRSDRWWYREMMETRKSFVSKAFFSATDGIATSSVYFPEFDDAGNMCGILGANIALDQIQKVVSSYDSEGPYSLIVDGDGVCIAHPEPEYVSQSYNYLDGTRLKSGSTTEHEPFNETDLFRKLTQEALNGVSGVT